MTDEANPVEPTPEAPAASPVAPPADLPALAIGERIEGTVVELGAEGAPGRLSLADGRVVHIEAGELTGEAPVEVGGVLSAFVVRLDPSGEIWVSRQKGSAALLLLLNARDHGETVRGKVVAHGPKGLEVDLGGGVFAICPPGEIGDDVDNPGHLVGQAMDFKVKDASATQVTISRKATGAKGGGPEAEKHAEEAAEVRRRLRPGAILPGRVSKLREFGAFVDLGGGVEGLIHLSELSHDRVAAAKDVVHAGQPVEVQVLKLDYDAHKGERISLSLKALTKSAWDAALAELKEGDKRKGKVARLESFGAFVELMPGVTGLAHVTALGGKRHAHPNETLKVGEEIDVEVLGVDKDKHRIALKRIPSETEVVEKKAAQAALREQKRDEARKKREESRKKPHERLQPGEIVDATVDRIEPYGFFLQLKGGGRGMVHVSEMGAAPEGVDPKLPLPEQFPKGAKLKVAVLEIDEKHRIRLSRLAVEEIQKGTTAAAYLKSKVQHELEEKLLRSAERANQRGGPPRGGPRGPKREGAAAGPGGPAQGLGRGPRAQPRERDRGGDRPRREGTGGGLKQAPKGGLGTLGDLLKAKLQQRKS